ncbi:MAG: TetR/AcrR family transcriptional regulator [Actinomycetota bacterium]
MPRGVDEAAKGRAAVEAALLEAAADLLAERGPSATSVRDIATRAGVNHGQVHHYFGGKRGLLVAAMRKLAVEHYSAVREQSSGRNLPAPLAQGEDQRYVKAVLRATIEGDIELARIEIDENVSVARRVLDRMAIRAGLEEPTFEQKLLLAEGTATQLGWMAFEQFLFLVADVGPDEQDAIREAFIDRAYRRGREEASPDPG